MRKHPIQDDVALTYRRVETLVSRKRSSRLVICAAVIGLVAACDDDDVTSPTPLTPDLNVASISVTPDRAAIEVGDSIQYTAVVRDSSNRVLDVALHWTISAAVGSISETGLFIASAEGTAVVTAIWASSTVSGTSGLEVVADGEIVIADEAVVLDSRKWLLLSTARSVRAGRIAS